MKDQNVRLVKLYSATHGCPFHMEIGPLEIKVIMIPEWYSWFRLELHRMFDWGVRYREYIGGFGHKCYVLTALGVLQFHWLGRKQDDAVPVASTK